MQVKPGCVITDVARPWTSRPRTSPNVPTSWSWSPANRAAGRRAMKNIGCRPASSTPAWPRRSSWHWRPLRDLHRRPQHRVGEGQRRSTGSGSSTAWLAAISRHVNGVFTPEQIADIRGGRSRRGRSARPAESPQRGSGVLRNGAADRIGAAGRDADRADGRGPAGAHRPLPQPAPRRRPRAAGRVDRDERTARPGPRPVLDVAFVGVETLSVPGVSLHPLVTYQPRLLVPAAHPLASADRVSLDPTGGRVVRGPPSGFATAPAPTTTSSAPASPGRWWSGGRP